jgi:hypothetical protein
MTCYSNDGEASPAPKHFLHFHRPLHGDLRVGVHAWHGLLLSPPEKRTFHVLAKSTGHMQVQTVEQVLRLYRERYFDFTTQRFQEKLRAENSIVIGCP